MKYRGDEVKKVTAKVIEVQGPPAFPLVTKA